MRRDFPWELFAFAIALALAVWWLLIKDQHDPGVSLWVGLGFGYGPAGNLTSIQSQYFAGANRYDGFNALPRTSTIVGNPLTDLAGNILTDVAGNPLTDTKGINQNAFPAQNNSSVKLTGNLSGSRPS